MTGDHTDPTCPFCERIAAEDYDDHNRALDIVHFEPLDPVTPGHRLFVPVNHIEHGTNAAASAVGHAMRSAAIWGKHQREAYNLITSSGAAATQTIHHLHIHYVPREFDDGLPLPWTPQKEQQHCTNLLTRLETLATRLDAAFTEFDDNDDTPNASHPRRSITEHQTGQTTERELIETDEDWMRHATKASLDSLNRERAKAELPPVPLDSDA